MLKNKWQKCLPLIFENVEADCTGNRTDVWMPDPRNKLDLHKIYNSANDHLTFLCSTNFDIMWRKTILTKGFNVGDWAWLQVCPRSNYYLNWVCSLNLFAPVESTQKHIWSHQWICIGLKLNAGEALWALHDASQIWLMVDGHDDRYWSNIWNKSLLNSI